MSDRPARPAERKRFSRRQWARRWGTLRLVLALVLVGAVAAGAGWVVYGSSVLGVDRVEVSGASGAAAAQVRAAAAVPPGQPLARVDLAAVQRRVEAVAVVRSADVTRSWPHAVRVEVVERTAVAVVEVGRRLRGMDAEGVLFRTYAAGAVPAGLPRLRLGDAVGREAMVEGATVAGALPDALRARVRYVEVRTVDDISLSMTAGRTVVWGSAEESEQKAEVLEALLKARRATTYDVSVPGQPTTRG